MFYNKSALVAEFLKIVCVSVGFITNDGEIKTQSFYGDDEKVILKDVQSLLKRIGNLGFCNLYAKGLSRKTKSRFGAKYISIYCRWVKVVFALRIHPAFFVPTTPCRWTAISVGAPRDQSAHGPLSNAIGPISTQKDRLSTAPTLTSKSLV